VYGIGLETLRAFTLIHRLLTRGRDAQLRFNGGPRVVCCACLVRGSWRSRHKSKEMYYKWHVFKVILMVQGSIKSIYWGPT